MQRHWILGVLWLMGCARSEAASSWSLARSRRSGGASAPAPGALRCAAATGSGCMPPLPSPCGWRRPHRGPSGLGRCSIDRWSQRRRGALRVVASLLRCIRSGKARGRLLIVGSCPQTRRSRRSSSRSRSLQSAIAVHGRAAMASATCRRRNDPARSRRIFGGAEARSLRQNRPTAKALCSRLPARRSHHITKLSEIAEHERVCGWIP